MPEITEPNASGLPGASQSQYVTPTTARATVAGAKTIGTTFFTQAQTQQSSNGGVVQGSVQAIPGGASQFVSMQVGEVTVPDVNVTSTFASLGATFT